MRKADIFKIAQWLVATCAVSVSSCFALIHFAYSDFDTQRTNNVYHEVIDQRFDDINKRLDDTNSELRDINNKFDRYLIYNHK